MPSAASETVDRALLDKDYIKGGSRLEYAVARRGSYYGGSTILTIRPRAKKKPNRRRPYDAAEDVKAANKRALAKASRADFVNGQTQQLREVKAACRDAAKKKKAELDAQRAARKAARNSPEARAARTQAVRAREAIAAAKMAKVQVLRKRRIGTRTVIGA